MNNQKEKEKDREEKLKELRRELEEKLEEQLSPELLEEKPRVQVEQINETEVQDPARARQIIESLLFASTKPVLVSEIRKVLKHLKPQEIEDHIRALQENFQNEARSFEIRQIAGGYEIGTKKEFAPWIMKLEIQKKSKQATQSALETLAILAYKQPVTRPEIEELRGVDVSGVINTLMSRGLVKIVGKKEVPGRPFLYGTTEKFLEHFGLMDLKELPNIEEIKALVENSVKREDLFQNNKIIAVSPEGEAPNQPEPEALETNLMVPGTIHAGSQRNDESQPAAQEN